MTEQKQQKDYWMKDNSVFVCDGQKYGVAPEGSTVGVGLVSGAIQTTPVAKKVVQKVKDEGLQGGGVSAQEKTVSYQPPSEKKVIGRPILDLPAEKIQSLYAQGLSVTKIMEQLRTEEIKVSRRTVYNVIAGQRVLI